MFFSCSFVSQNAEVSVFEVNIRFIGGLLAAYYLSGQEVRTLNFLSFHIFTSFIFSPVGVEVIGQFLALGHAESSFESPAEGVNAQNV